jgi:hypothetical protein
MRENRHFVRSTSISELAPVLTDGSPAVLSYRTTIENIEALAGRDAASLFAEPVFPQGATSLGAALSWYCPYEGSAVALDDIDEVARRPVAQKLSQRLAGLDLRDSNVGGILKSWLNISSTSDILSVGGEPVLVNWGFLPRSVAADPSAQAAHLAATLGRFAPFPSTSSAPGDGNGVPAAPPPMTAANQVDGPNANANGGGSGGAPPERQMPAGGSPPPVPMSASRRPWLAPLIAAAAALAILCVLLIPGVLVYPSDGARSEQGAFEEQRLRASNDSLERS